MNSAASTSAIPIQQQQQSHLPLPPSTAEHLLRAAATASQDHDMAGTNHTAAVARPLELPKKRKLPNIDAETVFSLVHTASMERKKESRENTARMAKLEEMVLTLQQTVEKVLNGLGNVSGKPVWGGEPTPTISTEMDSAETTTLSTSAKGKAKASPPLPPPARSDIARQPIASTSANDGSELSREHIPSTRPGEEGVYYMSPYMAAAVAETHPRSAPPNIEVFPMYSQIESLFSARPPPLPQSHPTPFSVASKPSAPKKARTVAPPSNQKDLATTATTTTTTTTSTPTSPSALEEKPPTFMMSRKVSKVTELWLEYSEGLNGLPSVFSQYVAPAPLGQGSTKKNNFPSETERKHFQRRRIILEEVERLSNVHGIEPKMASERLENFRIQRGYSLQKLQGVIKDGTLTADL